MQYVKCIFPLLLLILVGCQNRTSLKVRVKSNATISGEEIITLPLSKISQMDVNKLSAFDNNSEIPSQLVDTNNDGSFDEFVFLLDFTVDKGKIISITENENRKDFKQRAHAEIYEKRDYKLVNGVYTEGKFVSVKRTKTPNNHIDHNLFYKCEGPCWESDKVGYRFYLDQRNATDIFGKKTTEIVLPRVGDLTNMSYHKMADWGMDIFKVGKSLGIGSFAAYMDGKVIMVEKTDSIICSIVNDGPILASVNTKHYGWEFNNQKHNLDGTLSISAGSRLTKCKYRITGNNTQYCTGLAKHSGTEFIKSDNKIGWNYIATWGRQTMLSENLGTILFYKSTYNPSLAENELSYVVILAPIDGNIIYYFAACWELEPNGIKSKEKFIKYANTEIEKLNNPVEIEIIK